MMIWISGFNIKSGNGEKIENVFFLDRGEIIYRIVVGYRKCKRNRDELIWYLY